MQDFVDRIKVRSELGRSRGFTLVELLVATAVLSVLLLVLAQFSSMLGTTLATGYGRAERRQDGRALMDFIGQELRAAALPVDRTVEVGSPGLQMVVNPLSVGAEYCQPHAVFWQAPLATETTLGNMAVMGFFVRWEDADGNKPPKASLCRVLINPSKPGDSDEPNPNYLIYTNENNWMTNAILDEVAPADDESSYLGLFADDVIGFWVRCLDVSGQVIKQPGANQGRFDSRLGYVAMVKSETGNLVNKSVMGPALPHSVEVSLLILDSRAASELNSALVGKIQDLASSLKSDDDTKTSPAEKMSKVMLQDPDMRKVVQGMSTQSMRIYLENSP